MEWTDEPHVRVYTRDTEDYIALSWEARAVWHELLRKLDSSGRLEMRRGRRALAALIRVPPEVVELAITELVADGCLRELATGYLAPNFATAQKAPKSPKLRAREARERAQQTVTKRDEPVTNRDGAVTECDAIPEIRPDLSLRISSDLQSLPPELPDHRKIVSAEHGPVVRAPGQIPGPGQVPDQRRKLNHDAWQYAAREHAQLRAEGIAPDAVPWPPMPAGAPMGDLVERTREVLAQTDPPDYGAAWASMKRRIDVASAEARREHHLNWFTPTRLWDAKTFWRALEFTPQQAGQPRIAPAARPAAPSEPARRIRTLNR
jgi:hypothetical protein